MADSDAPKVPVNTGSYSVPGLSSEAASTIVGILQDRLVAYTDLHLTLKHVHWNVVGPNFIAVHEMLDPQVDAVREYADDVAERIATLGGSPVGTPGALVKSRSWDDYSIGRAPAIEHLGALDIVYAGVLTDSRRCITELEELDPVTEDMIVGHTEKLELFHWFVRAHLENSGGELSTAGASSEKGAAAQASDAARGAA